MRGTRQSGWLSHYALRRKVWGPIPDHWFDSRSLVLPIYLTLPAALGPGLTQLLTEMSTRKLPGNKGWPERRTDDLTAICEQIV
jgi:hypothetical protein